jgi:hypothetical protein
MSDSISQPAITTSFGVPESNFLRLAADVLTGLELQSRERGLERLAALIGAAKVDAEGSLQTPGEGGRDTAETKLLKIVGAIRGQVKEASPVAKRKRP